MIKSPFFKKYFSILDDDSNLRLRFCVILKMVIFYLLLDLVVCAVYISVQVSGYKSWAFIIRIPFDFFFVIILFGLVRYLKFSKASSSNLLQFLLYVILTTFWTESILGIANQDVNLRDSDIQILMLQLSIVYSLLSLTQGSMCLQTLQSLAFFFYILFRVNALTENKQFISSVQLILSLTTFHGGHLYIQALEAEDSLKPIDTKMKSDQTMLEAEVHSLRINSPAEYVPQLSGRNYKLNLQHFLQRRKQSSIKDTPMSRQKIQSDLNSLENELELMVSENSFNGLFILNPELDIIYNNSKLSHLMTLDRCHLSQRFLSSLIINRESIDIFERIFNSNKQQEKIFQFVFEKPRLIQTDIDSFADYLSQNGYVQYIFKVTIDFLKCLSPFKPPKTTEDQDSQIKSTWLNFTQLICNLQDFQLQKSRLSQTKIMQNQNRIVDFNLKLICEIDGTYFRVIIVPSNFQNLVAITLFVEEFPQDSIYNKLEKTVFHFTKMLEHFIKSLSDDVYSTISSIELHQKTAMQQSTKATSRDLLDTSIARCLIISNTIQNMREYHRIVNKEMITLNSRLLDIRDFLNETTQIFRIDTACKGINLHLKVKGSIPQVIQSDAIRLKQLIINLMSIMIEIAREGDLYLVCKKSYQNDILLTFFLILNTFDEFLFDELLDQYNRLKDSNSSNQPQIKGNNRINSINILMFVTGNLSKILGNGELFILAHKFKNKSLEIEFIVRIKNDFVDIQQSPNFSKTQRSFKRSFFSHVNRQDQVPKILVSHWSMQKEKSLMLEQAHNVVDSVKMEDSSSLESIQLSEACSEKNIADLQRVLNQKKIQNISLELKETLFIQTLSGKGIPSRTTLYNTYTKASSIQNQQLEVEKIPTLIKSVTQKPFCNCSQILICAKPSVNQFLIQSQIQALSYRCDSIESVTDLKDSLITDLQKKRQCCPGFELVIMIDEGNLDVLKDLIKKASISVVKKIYLVLVSDQLRIDSSDEILEIYDEVFLKPILLETILFITRRYVSQSFD